MSISPTSKHTFEQEATPTISEKKITSEVKFTERK